MRRTLLFLIPVLSLGLASCRDSAVTPLTDQGVFLVSVTGAEQEVIGKATYESDTGKVHSVEGSFRGEFPVYRRGISAKKKRPVELIGLALLDQNEQLLAQVSREELSKWGDFAKAGVRVVVTLTKDATGARQAELNFLMTRVPWMLSDLDQPYRDMADVSSVAPEAILDLQDAETAIDLLRRAATPTERFHEDLLELATRRSSLTPTQLRILLSAAFYTLGGARQMDERGSRPESIPGPDDRSVKQARAQAHVKRALELADYTNQLLAAGIPMLETVSFDEAIQLLEMRYPKKFTSEDLEPALKNLVTRLPSLSGEQKLQLVSVALADGYETLAVDLFMSWFRTDAQRSIPALAGKLNHFVERLRRPIAEKAIQEVGERLKAGDLVALAAVLPGSSVELAIQYEALIATLTAAELGTLVAHCQHSYEVLKTYYSRVSDLNHSTVLNLLAALRGADRRDLLLAYLVGVSSIRVDELVGILEYLPSGRERDDLVISMMKRVSDKTDVNIARLFALLSADFRSVTILRFIDELENLTTEVLIALANAAPEHKSFILLAYLDRVSDFTPTNAVLISQQLRVPADKDSVLLLAVERARTLTSDELYAIAAASAERTQKFLVEQLNKVTDLTPEAVAKMTRLLRYGGGDQLIMLALEQKLTKVSTEGVIVLSRACYHCGTRMITDYLDRITDFTPDNAIRLAGTVSYGSRDKVILGWFARNEKVTTDDLIRLSSAAYERGSSILIDEVEKVSDLTVDNAIRTVSRLSYGSKDRFLLKAVDLVTDLNADNLIPLANRAYQQRDAVLQKGINRLASTGDGQEEGQPRAELR